MAYELVAGAPPFMHEDRMVMYRRIVDGVYSCPTHFSPVGGSTATAAWPQLLATDCTVKVVHPMYACFIIGCAVGTCT